MRDGLLAGLLLLLLAGCPGPPEPDDDDVTDDDDSADELLDGEALLAELEPLADQAKVPGLAACVFTTEDTWCGALGLADVAGDVPVQTDTAFLLASVSKTVTATALMQRRDAVDFALDDDVADALDFPCQHPDGEPFTYRQLLTHTASIRDNWDAMGDWYSEGQDPDLGLAEVIQGYFTPFGAWYDADANFGTWAPGEQFEYANMGASLAGHLAAEHAGQPFDALTRAAIFEPLGMTASSWWLEDFAPGELAMPNAWTGSAYAPYGQYNFADIPSGALRASAEDMARFGRAFLRGGELDGQRILAEETVLEMHTAWWDDEVGLGWFVGQGWWGHDGGEAGAATSLWLRPELGVGWVALMNGDGEDGGAMSAIGDALSGAAEGVAP